MAERVIVDYLLPELHRGTFLDYYADGDFSAMQELLMNSATVDCISIADADYDDYQDED